MSQDTVSREATPQTLRDFTANFNTRDLDAVMSYFTDDAVFDSPRGPDPWGRRFSGKDEVREGLAARFAGLPQLHYGDDEHFVVGDRGFSSWTLTGTTVDETDLQVRGCDLWTFRDGLILRKDSFWKIRE
jgi:ketosteroid isomerase-like protein